MAYQADVPEWMTVEQFIKHTGGGFSYSFVTKLARSGQIKSYRVGAKWRIHRDAENELFQQHQRRSNP